MFHVPIRSTDTATPISPARKTNVDVKSRQYFPNDQNNMTPMMKAQRQARVGRFALLLFIFHPFNNKSLLRTICLPDDKHDNSNKRHANHKQHHQKAKTHHTDLHSCLFNHQKYAVDFKGFWIAFYLNYQNHSRAILLACEYAVWRMEKS